MLQHAHLARPGPRRSNSLGGRRLRRGTLALALSVLAVGLPVAVAADDGAPHGRGSGPTRKALLVDFAPAASSDGDAEAVLGTVGATEIGRLDADGTRVVTVPPGRHDAAVAQLEARPAGRLGRG